MHWIHLTEEEQLKNIISCSQAKPQIIFKHSSRCSISDVALRRLQKISCREHIDFYFLDLIAYRSLSDKISETFKKPHKSPQVLMVINGDCVYEESHLGISPEELLEQITI